jgi:hypothetical protein
MIGQLRHRKTFAAQGAVAERRMRVPFYLDHFTILYVGDNPASAMAVSAGSSNLFYIFHKNPLILFHEIQGVDVSEECAKLKGEFYPINRSINIRLRNPRRLVRFA